MQGLAKQSDNYMVQEVTTPRIELPSAFQVGWEVCLQFGGGEIIRGCWITRVIFTRSKVLYDVQIAVYDSEGCKGFTRIHSVESDFVKPYDHGHTTITKWTSRKELPDTDRLVDCRITGDQEVYRFLARVKWDGGGVEWFDEQGTPIRDAVQFEWTEIKKPGKTVKDFVNEREILKQVEEMCTESLAPDEYEEWNKILNIIRTRRHHA